MAIRDRVNRSIESLSDEYGEILVAKLKKNIADIDKYATGDLVDTMYYEVKSDGVKSVIRLNANHYLRYVDKGRRPGKYPPLWAISKWATVKGISQRAVFPIARKIAERGTPATNVINKTLDQVKSEFLPIYEKNLADIVGVVLVNDIFNQTTTKGTIISKKLR
jgi:hypothetical protein